MRYDRGGWRRWTRGLDEDDLVVLLGLGSGSKVSDGPVLLGLWWWHVHVDVLLDQGAAATATRVSTATSGGESTTGASAEAAATTTESATGASAEAAATATESATGASAEAAASSGSSVATTGCTTSEPGEAASATATTTSWCSVATAWRTTATGLLVAVAGFWPRERHCGERQYLQVGSRVFPVMMRHSALFRGLKGEDGAGAGGGG